MEEDMQKEVDGFCIDLRPVLLVIAIITSLIACKAQTETTEQENHQRTYRCQHADLIEQRHNEMFLAGQPLPALIIIGCTNKPDRTIDVSPTTRILSARADQLMSNELTPRQQAERVTTDILRIKATGARNLEYIDCFTGIACIFTGPLVEMNDLEHLTQLLKQRAEEKTKTNNTRGTPDSDAKTDSPPISVDVPW